MGMEGGGGDFFRMVCCSDDGGSSGRPVVREMPRAKRFSIARWCDIHRVLAMIVECL